MPRISVPEPTRPSAAKLGALVVAAAISLMIDADSARAESWQKVGQYQVIDGVNLWVTTDEPPANPNEFKLQSFAELEKSKQLRLAWTDAANANANRPVSKFLDLPLPYVKLRQEWLRWIRQVQDIAEPGKKALEDLLASEKEKIRYRPVPEAAAPRRSEKPQGITWVELEAGGTEVARHLIREGWAIPFLPPGVKEPKDWESRLDAMQSAMNGCKGMWKQILTQCRGK